MQRKKKIPLIVRIIPEKHHGKLFNYGFIIGLLCKLVLEISGLIALFFGPLYFFYSRPGAPICAPLRWLRSNFENDTFLIIYTFVAMFVVLFVLAGIDLFDYITKTQNKFNEYITPDESIGKKEK